MMSVLSCYVTVRMCRRAAHAAARARASNTICAVQSVLCYGTVQQPDRCSQATVQGACVLHAICNMLQVRQYGQYSSRSMCISAGVRRLMHAQTVQTDGASVRQYGLVDGAECACVSAFAV